MSVRIDEIAPDTFRLSTFVPDLGPDGFTFNQFLIRDDEPLLFHTGHRHTFPEVAAAIGSLMPIERLRWITFGHVEADECGAMNEFLAAAPNAEVAHGALGCMVSLDDLADRKPVPLADGHVFDLGSHRVRHIDTPHVPHGWEGRVLFDETTSTLLCGDLFTQFGAGPDGPAVTEDDIVAPAGIAEDVFGATCLAPRTGSTIRVLADLSPSALALMHGPSFRGDGGAALRALADDYDERVRAAAG